VKALYSPQFGRAAILAEPSGYYQPAESGTSRPTLDSAILAVADRYGAICDLVAWQPSDPYRWWVRTGSMPVLGEAEIDRAGCLDAPLLLLGTPHDWLLNHGKGGYWPAATVLDWSADPRTFFNGVRIMADGEAVARQLEAAQRRHDRPLDIQVRWSEADRAAA
jgi:hypothetical protein